MSEASENEGVRQGITKVFSQLQFKYGSQSVGEHLTETYMRLVGSTDETVGVLIEWFRTREIWTRFPPRRNHRGT